MKNNTEFGFGIRQIASELKRVFDSAGYAGWVSFIKASIRAGIVRKEDILEDAIAITGDHIEEAFDLLIEEGINQYWHRDKNGCLSVADLFVAN